MYSRMAAPREKKVVRTLLVDPHTKRFPLVSTFGRTGYFEMPGGRVDQRETLREAAERELHEEIGVLPPPLQHLGSITVPTDQKREVWRAHLFFGTHRETELMLNPNEISTATYASLIEALGMPLELFTRKLLESIVPLRRP